MPNFECHSLKYSPRSSCYTLTDCQVWDAIVTLSESVKVKQQKMKDSKEQGRLSQSHLANSAPQRQWWWRVPSRWLASAEPRSAPASCPDTDPQGRLGRSRGHRTLHRSTATRRTCNAASLLRTSSMVYSNRDGCGTVAGFLVTYFEVFLLIYKKKESNQNTQEV